MKNYQSSPWAVKALTLKKNGSPCQLKLARRPVKKVKFGLIGFEFRQSQKIIDIEVIISNDK